METYNNQNDDWDTINTYIASTIQEGSFDDKAFGCIIGAMIADSCGSYLEFSQGLIYDDNVMSQCMKMPGGGCWSVGPGQVTDDSELAMCLMWGLI